MRQQSFCKTVLFALMISCGLCCASGAQAQTGVVDGNANPNSQQIAECNINNKAAHGMIACPSTTGASVTISSYGAVSSDPGQALTPVDVYSQCRYIDNNSTSNQSIFVPFKTQAEWTAFLANGPSYINLVHCSVPYVPTTWPVTMPPYTGNAGCPTSPSVASPQVYSRWTLASFGTWPTTPEIASFNGCHNGSTTIQTSVTWNGLDSDPPPPVTYLPTQSWQPVVQYGPDITLSASTNSISGGPGIHITVDAGTPVTLTWNVSSPVVSASASSSDGTWSGGVSPASGAQVVTPNPTAPATSITYTYTAINSLGLTSVATAIVTVNAAKINGQCGTWSGYDGAKAPTGGQTYCTQGTYQAETCQHDDGYYECTWTCQGTNGGADIQCGTNDGIGQCGGAINETFSSPPITGLCNTGTASGVSGTGPWTWSCVGTTSTASCTAASSAPTTACTTTPTMCASGTSTGTSQQLFTSSGTFVAPANAVYPLTLRVLTAAGGQGGGPGSECTTHVFDGSIDFTGNDGSGGTNGAITTAIVTLPAPMSIPVTVGNAGPANSGMTPDMNSSFGSFVTASGNGGEYGGGGAYQAYDVDNGYSGPGTAAVGGGPYTPTCAVFTGASMSFGPGGGNGGGGGGLLFNILGATYGTAIDGYGSGGSGGSMGGPGGDGCFQGGDGAPGQPGAVYVEWDNCSGVSTPINGQCGSAANMPVASAPTSNLCANNGTASNVSGSGPWTWTCAGQNGGSSSGTCSAPVATAVNGVCAQAVGTCTTGTSSAPSDNGTTTTWTCSGTNGGTSQSCSGTDGQCNPAPYTPGGCYVGTASAPVDDGNQTTWTCGGSGNILQESCSTPDCRAPFQWYQQAPPSNAYVCCQPSDYCCWDITGQYCF